MSRTSDILNRERGIHVSSYLKHINSTECMFVGERFPLMLEAAKTEASRLKWTNYCTARGILNARTFSHACRVMGVDLIYEGNDRFTVELDGTYESSLLIPLAECLAPYINDGEIVAERENGQILFMRFQRGEFAIFGTKVEIDEEE